MNKDYDVVIIGGGLAGASLACALADSPARIAVIEAVPAQSMNQPSFDDRGLALSLSSRDILEDIGIWADVSQHACPVRGVHVSDRGHFGFVRFHAKDFNVEALGFVTTARELGQALMSGIHSHDNIDLICPAKTLEIKAGPGSISLMLARDGVNMMLSCRLLVAADGARSETCSKLGIAVRSKKYEQTAIVANVETEKHHDYIAYERFTHSGPVALLPLSEHHSKMVFTVRTEKAGYYMDLSDPDFLQQLQLRFSKRLGKFTRIGKRTSYPLMLLESEQQVRGRTVLVGNSAHTIHPHGAQGLNLSLRDIAALSTRLLPALNNRSDPGNPDLLDAYLADRLQDQKNIISFSDGLATLFYNQQPLKVLARNSGMLLMDLVPAMKRKLFQLAMGKNVRLPAFV